MLQEVTKRSSYISQVIQIPQKNTISMKTQMNNDTNKRAIEQRNKPQRHVACEMSPGHHQVRGYNYSQTPKGN